MQSLGFVEEQVRTIMPDYKGPIGELWVLYAGPTQDNYSYGIVSGGPPKRSGENGCIAGDEEEVRRLRSQNQAESALCQVNIKCISLLFSSSFLRSTVRDCGCIRRIPFQRKGRSRCSGKRQRSSDSIWAFWRTSLKKVARTRKVMLTYQDFLSFSLYNIMHISID